MADIGDVYAWMTSDGNNVNLAMTVSPGDQGVNTFGPSVQYAWHVSSHVGTQTATAFGAPGSEERVVCTFTDNTHGECWVVKGTTVLDYVKGDPSTSMTSASGKMKVFAGRRSDPFFFNLAGFKKTIAAVEGAGVIPPNAAGCPAVPTATATVLRTFLTTPVVTGAAAPCPNNQADCFLNFNVMAIVAQVDKTLLAQGDATDHHLLSVWGSTHAKP
ncbi:MAG: DUF4331 family protein [Kofleriaceae bacterium]